MLRVEPLEQRRLLSVVQYSGEPSGTGTDFNSATNWVCDAVPGPGDDAVIGAQFASETITSAADRTVKSVTSEAAFQVSGGTFTVASTIAVDNTVTALGGWLIVSASSTLNRGLNLAGGAVGVGTGAILTLAGAVNTWTGGTITGTFTGTGPGTVVVTSGALTIGSAGATLNFPSGMFQWSGGSINGTSSTGDANALTNNGSMTLTGSGTKTLDTNVTLNNSGTVTDSGSGSFNFNYKATLNNLSGGNLTLSGSESINPSPFAGGSNAIHINVLQTPGA